MSLETEISIMLKIMMVLEIWCWKYGVRSDRLNDIRINCY